MVDYWLGHTHRFLNVDCRREGVGAVLINTAASSAHNNTSSVESTPVKQNSSSGKKAPAADHPLAEPEEKPETPSPPPAMLTSPSSKLTPVTPDNIARRLSSNDVDRMRTAMKDFCANCLVPYLERQIRTLHESATNRSKSRSFLSGAKRWFGQNKAGGIGANAGTSVVYSKEAPELQTRKLGDLYFMLRLYKQANGCFQLCKKDFQADEAWNYYAGAAEMAALSHFLAFEPSSGSGGKKYPAHYMEDAIQKYLQICAMPEFAVRATLLDALCLKYLGSLTDAASRYIRMTNEARDLRSALLFEQAAYCHLLANPASVRKYAFHVVLAGYRYSKAGQKLHSARAYRQGFQVYKDKGWNLSEDHILYNLGHQSFLLKDHLNACKLFNDLLSMNRPNPNQLTQMCHLREFFIVHHQREKEEKVKSASVIPIPDFKVQESVLELDSKREIVYEESGSMHPGSSWQELERVVCERISGQEIMFLSRTCQTTFTPVSKNNLTPQTGVGEPVRLVMPVENKFHTSLVLKKVHLLWKFNNEDKGKSAAEFVKTESADMITLERNSKILLTLTLTPLKAGDLILTGVEYGIKAQFPQSESTDYTVRGKQYFKVQGPRLKATKEHKTSVVYGPDNRLNLSVRDKMPKLQLELEIPESLFQGELRTLEMKLTNVGPVTVNKIFLITHSPGFMSLKSSKAKSKKNLFDYPVVIDAALSGLKENGDVLDKPLDFIPLNETISPGKSVTIRVRIRGPDKIGVNELQLFCYYEHDPKEKSHRIFSKNFGLKVKPSVAASASRSGVDAHKNDPDESVVLHVSNISKDSVRVLEPIFISRIDLASHSDKLVALQSKNSNCPVAKTDSAALGLKIQTIHDDDENRLHFSTLKTAVSSGEESAVLDFLKSGFEFPPKERPKLKEDLVVVHWHGSDESVKGVSIVPLRRLKPYPKGDSVDNSAKNTKDKEFKAPRLLKQCQVQLEHPDLVHFVEDDDILCVNCKMNVANSDSKSKFSLKVDEESNEIVGCSSGEFILAANEEKSVEFGLIVAQPGLIMNKSLRYQVSDPHLEPDDDSFIPVEICVTVERRRKNN